MKTKNFLKISFLCGIAPLSLGFALFLAWWVSRAYFAIDAYRIEQYMYGWFIISVPVAIVGLLFLISYYSKDSSSKIRSLGVLLLILMNIPSLFFILEKQEEIKKRAYLKISNEGLSDFYDVKIVASDVELKIGDLLRSSSKVVCYQPKDIDTQFDDSNPPLESIRLVSKSNTLISQYQFARIEKGGYCKLLYLDKEMKLVDEMEHRMILP